MSTTDFINFITFKLYKLKINVHKINSFRLHGKYLSVANG